MDGYAGMKRAGEDDADAGTKRHKTVGESKVLHVRGLPTFCSEEELSTVCQPFGKVVKCLVLQEKHQAFVQMENAEQAAQLLSNLEFSQPSIRSKAVYFQYSSRQEVEVRHNPSSMGGAGAGAAGAAGGAGGSPTLLVTISNVTVPVTLENILQICKPYGEVLKIITFQKGADMQALVQMHSVEAATQALTFLEGKDMFQGCCHLNVGFSKRHNLIVKQNNHKSRDFTVPQGQGDMGQQQQQGFGMPPQMGGMGGMGMGMPQQDQFGGMGGQPGMPQQDQYGQHANQQYQMGGHDQRGQHGQMGGDFGRQGAFGMQPQHGGGGFDPMGGMGGGGTPCVLVSDLNEKLVNADSLFKLFGVYGDVLRVKILFNKRSNALIQYANSQQAAFALQNLSNCPLHGNYLKVAPSKFQEVNVPRDDPEGGSDLTKDYTDSREQRFRGRPVNPKNVNPPSQVLHLSNLHDSCTEQELRDMFSAQQQAAPVVEFFKSSRKMCYIAMESVEAAVTALVALHNFQLQGHHLRVSFSPKDASAITNSDM